MHQFKEHVVLHLSKSFYEILNWALLQLLKPTVVVPFLCIMSLQVNPMLENPLLPLHCASDFKERIQLMNFAKYKSRYPLSIDEEFSFEYLKYASVSRFK